MKPSLLFRRLRKYAFAGCSLLLAESASFGATHDYPKDKPAFRLTIPDGWQFEEDTNRPERLLNLTPKDGKITYQIYFLSTVGIGMDGLGEAAARLAAATVGDNPKITRLTLGAPVESVLATRVRVGRAEAACLIEGEPTYFQFAVFCPLGGRRFEAVLCSPMPAKEYGIKQLDSILHSIKPIEPKE